MCDACCAKLWSVQSIQDMVLNLLVLIHLLIQFLDREMEQIALKWNDFEENVKSAFKVSIAIYRYLRFSN
jgi:hypothetical protein